MQNSQLIINFSDLIPYADYFIEMCPQYETVLTSVYDVTDVLTLLVIYWHQFSCKICGIQLKGNVFVIVDATYRWHCYSIGLGWIGPHFWDEFVWNHISVLSCSLVLRKQKVSVMQWRHWDNKLCQIIGIGIYLGWLWRQTYRQFYLTVTYLISGISECNYYHVKF